jgi:hypothetical protein
MTWRDQPPDDPEVHLFAYRARIGLYLKYSK